MPYLQPVQSPTPTQPPVARRDIDTVTLPLTTIFTPPQSCLDAPFTLSNSAANAVGFSSAWRDRNETSSDCYPSSFSSLEFFWHWYSPGVCPSGYQTAQTRLTTFKGTPTTQAWCCPSGMTISGSSNYQFCSSFVATQTSALSADSTSSGVLVGNIHTVQNIASFIALQWPISVEWAEKDLTSFTPASAPVLTTSSSASSSSSSVPSLAATASVMEASGTSNDPSSTASPTESPSSGTSGLSTGAKAGIGAGIGAAALIALLGLAFWLVRRHRSKQNAELGCTEEKRRALEPRAGDSSPSEMDGTAATHEMDASQAPVELEAETREAKIGRGATAELQ